MQLTRPRVAEACKQSLFRDRVLNEIDLSIEVKPECAGPDVPHGDDRSQVSFLTPAD